MAKLKVGAESNGTPVELYSRTMARARLSS